MSKIRKVKIIIIFDKLSVCLKKNMAYFGYVDFQFYIASYAYIWVQITF